MPNPRHLSNAAYLALASAAARAGARRNGVPARRVSVAFPDAGFAPTRIEVVVRGRAGPGMPGHAHGGGYTGPLAYRQGKPMRPDVAQAFDRMAAAARSEAGLHLLVTSHYRSDAEQARLWAARPMPHLFLAL